MKGVTIFAKSSFLDIELGSEYASEDCPKTNFKLSNLTLQRLAVTKCHTYLKENVRNFLKTIRLLLLQ